jgi:hypothetical protein
MKRAKQRTLPSKRRVWMTGLQYFLRYRNARVRPWVVQRRDNMDAALVQL